GGGVPASQDCRRRIGPRQCGGGNPGGTAVGSGRIITARIPAGEEGPGARGAICTGGADGISPAAESFQMTRAILPDSLGHFGPYGGRYVPEVLMSPLEELEEA